MLHSLIIVRGYCIDIRDDISEKRHEYFTCFPVSILVSGATDLNNKRYGIFPNTVCIMLNIEPQTEKIDLHLNKIVQ